MQATGDNKPGDGEELSQVSARLRRYAEELAHISARLGGGDGASGAEPGPAEAGERPPVQTEPLLHAKGGERESTLPVRAEDTVLDSDSLPVLNAFRQFLENERRRTRARMISLSIWMGVLMVAILAAALFVGKRALHRTRTDLEQVKAETEQKDKAVRDTLKGYAKESEEMSRGLDRDRRSLRAVAGTASNLQKIVIAERQQSKAARDELLKVVSNQFSEIERLREMITDLEIENASLVSWKNETQAGAERPRMSDEEWWQAEKAAREESGLPDTIPPAEVVEDPMGPRSSGRTPAVPFRLP